MNEMSEIAEKFLQRQNEMLEGEIRRVMADYDCGISDLVVEWRYFDSPPFKVRYVPPEEKWLNWQSDNHGWS